MPGTIRNFFATIDPVSPPPEQPRDLALRPNRSHRDETFKLELLRWRRRVLPPGLPAVRSKFQRHRLATQRPYARSRRKDRLVWAVDRGLSVLERAKGIEPSYAAWEAAVLPLNYARGRFPGYCCFLLRCRDVISFRIISSRKEAVRRNSRRWRPPRISQAR